jgi:hypothetical protein
MVEQAKEFLKVKLMDWAESWLLNLRQEYRAASRALTEEEASGMRGYFSDELLAQVRIAPVERIANPGFFGSLPDLGIPVPWDFSAEPALSVVDTIVMSRPLIPADDWSSILFEECVHVQHFQTLGVSKLVGRYVSGLLANGFDYRGLPLERQARELRMRFDAGLKTFSVEQIVETALLKGAI